MKSAAPKTVTIPTSVVPILYNELGNEIRHYNTVRTSLTTFLMTVAVTALSAFLKPDQHHEFLVVVGYVFSIAGLISCWFCSFLSAKAVIRYGQLRNCLLNPATAHFDAEWKNRRAATRKMLHNFMNWLMLCGVVTLIFAFQLTSHPGLIFTRETMATRP